MADPEGYCTLCHLPWHLCECFKPKKGNKLMEDMMWVAVWVAVFWVFWVSR